MVGFGIKDQQTAENMSNFSDGVVIGSAIVNMIEHIQTRKTENDFAKISKFVGEIKSSLQ